MTIDERARAAATDLLERAADRPAPTVDAIDTVPRRRHLPVLAVAAAVVVLAVVGVAVLRGGDDEMPPAMPGGGASRTWAPAGLGVSLQVPATWQDSGPVSGFAFAVGAANRDGSVLADRLPLLTEMDRESMALARSADLQAYGTSDISTSITEVDGRPAALLRYRLHPPGEPGTTYAVTEYDVQVTGWVLVVAIGEREPADRSEITDWIASTLQVRELTAEERSIASPLAQPDRALAPPVGVEATIWAPEGFGVSLSAPADWRDQTPSGARYRQLFPPGGGPHVSVTRITSAEATSREEDIRYEGGVIEATAETTVDGRPTRAIRYWRAAQGYPLRVTIIVEYLIDAGDGGVLMVQTAENAGGEDQADLLRWIRSTIRLT